MEQQQDESIETTGGEIQANPNAGISIINNGEPLDVGDLEGNDGEVQDEGGEGYEGEDPVVEDTENQEGETADLQAQIDKHSKTIDALKKDLGEKGVDFNEAVKEYNASGTLSKQTIADLVKAGYPQEVIETFIESRVALEERFTKTVYDLAGGQKEYTSLMQWAGANLPEKVVKSFNKAVDNNNLEAISLMLEGIKAKRVAKMGTRNPSILGGSPASASTYKGFANVQEMTKAMSDPRYGRDAEYTRSVEMKMYHTTNKLY